MRASGSAEPPAATGRTEESARTTGTAGYRPEVVKAEEFARLAAAGGRFEIQSGKLAVDRAKRQELRDLAQQMVNDHSKSLDQRHGLMQQDAALKGKQMPQDLDPQRQRWMEQLRAAAPCSHPRGPGARRCPGGAPAPPPSPVPVSG